MGRIQSRRPLGRAARIGAATLIVGGTTWLVGQALAGLVVVHVVGSVLHHVVRGMTSTG
jgi:hypothetical protein